MLLRLQCNTVKYPYGMATRVSCWTWSTNLKVFGWYGFLDPLLLRSTTLVTYASKVMPCCLKGDSAPLTRTLAIGEHHPSEEVLYMAVVRCF